MSSQDCMYRIEISAFFIFLNDEKGFSDHTIKSYKNDINKFLNFLSERKIELKEVSKIDIRDFLADQYDLGLSKKTIARRLASIKSLFKFLFNSSFVTKNPTLFLSTPKMSKKLPDFIDEKMINELMNQPDLDTEKGLRDKAVLELFYSTGMRLSELISLINSSSYIVSNDTGPAHICAHLNKNGVVLFGSHTTPEKVSMESPNFKSIRADNLKNLNVADVYEKIKESLN